MDKRVIFALGLSLLVLIGFQAIMTRLYPQAVISSPQKKVSEEVKYVQKTEHPTETQQIVPDEKEIIFQNDLYTITFSDVGAGIKKITLNKNPKAGLNISYDIFNAKIPQDSQFIFIPDNIGIKLNNGKYDYKNLNDGLLFRYNCENDFIIEKRYIFHNTLYHIELKLNWINLKGTDLVKEYAISSGVHLPATHMDERFLEISANLDNKVLKNKKSGRAFEIQRKGVLNWILLKNRYFSIWARPEFRAKGYMVKQDNFGKLTSGITADIQVQSNSNSVQKYSFYVGPTDIKLAKEANIGAENAFAYGFLGSIGQVLMSILRFSHKISKNWGISILLLAIFINTILFPLTRKSYKSMHEMQILQPKIEKLRQEHKANPQKLQREIMELYKKYKINPMGGCLPLVLQMPIFFALYNGLINFIELRGAKFLWIKDLSMTENIKLPITLPLVGNSVNILPLLMLVAMFFQQRLTNKFTSISQTDEQRQQQKFMMIFMTIMFGFIFYNLPSGFVLYWLFSTVIMTAIQSMLTRAPRPISIDDR